MSQPQLKSWTAIQAEVLRRIHTREWRPGQTIPGEVELAREFGCARATVNRAMQALADAGILERRRKAGTRVALHPVSKATLEIPVIRQEIEDQGLSYSYRLIDRERAKAPIGVQATMRGAADCLHVSALHLADGTPYVFEDRWINLVTVPDAGDEQFEIVSANEWLLTHAPYTQGDISFTAAAADKTEAGLLGADEGDPIFVVERTTWDQDRAITSVRLSYTPGYRIHTTLGGTL